MDRIKLRYRKALFAEKIQSSNGCWTRQYLSKSLKEVYVLWKWDSIIGHLNSKLICRSFAANPSERQLANATSTRYFHDVGFEGHYASTLSPSDQWEIIDAFQLPAPITWSSASRSTHFQRYSSSSTSLMGWYSRSIEHSMDVLNHSI
jgi:hypothetical protein